MFCSVVCPPQAIGGFNTGTLKKAPDSGVRGAVPQVNYGGLDNKDEDVFVCYLCNMFIEFK